MWTPCRGGFIVCHNILTMLFLSLKHVITRDRILKANKSNSRDAKNFGLCLYLSFLNLEPNFRYSSFSLSY